MDSRGFGSRQCRTLARPRAFALSDVALVAGALVVISAATAASIALGSWRPILSF
jgi:energy-coupling factor transport system permease protein